MWRSEIPMEVLKGRIYMLSRPRERRKGQRAGDARGGDRGADTVEAIKGTAVAERGREGRGRRGEQVCVGAGVEGRGIA